MTNDSNEIKQKKLEELKQQYVEQQRKQSEAVQAEMQLNELMKQLLSPEAKARLGNVKLANRELYLKAVQAIIYLHRAGQIKGKLGEEQLKQLLEKLREKREIRIKRK